MYLYRQNACVLLRRRTIMKQFIFTCKWLQSISGVKEPGQRHFGMKTPLNAYFCLCEVRFLNALLQKQKESRNNETDTIHNYYTLHSSRIGGYRNTSGQSVHLSVHCHAFLHDNWLDFLHTYHDQVPSAHGFYQ